MTEIDIKILMKDGCTRHDAIKFLEKGTIIFSDLKESFTEYEKDFYSCSDEEDKKALYDMVFNDAPMPGWGIVHDIENRKDYFILYII